MKIGKSIKIKYKKKIQKEEKKIRYKKKKRKKDKYKKMAEEKKIRYKKKKRKKDKYKKMATIQRLVNTKRCFCCSYDTNKLSGKINRNPVNKKKNKYHSFSGDRQEYRNSPGTVNQETARTVTPWGKPLGAPGDPKIIQLPGHIFHLLIIDSRQYS